MSEQNIEQHPQAPAPPDPILLNTRIEFLNQKYYFHDILKESVVNKHYIAEDLEHEAGANASGGFFYLKQSLYSHKGEYQYALKYYQKLLNYCKMPFAKTDIIRLHQIHNFDSEESGYFEVVLLFDLGEPDRIDVDNIESQHITKFLKNVCLLLQDLKKFDQIYHGNIYIKNIVLVNTELKLSGFKPIYLDNPDYQTWKVHLARQYNHFRSDLYLIGLIWLRFLGADVEAATRLQFSLDEVKENVGRTLEALPEDKKMPIVQRLLDLENHPDLTLDDVILEFDEFYILENIRNVEQERKRLAESGALETDSQHNPAFSNDEHRPGSIDDRFDSLGQAGLRKSDSKDTNPFMRPYKESERDILALKGLDLNEHHASESRQNPDYLKIDGDFTLKDDDSMIAPQRLSKDELITIQDVKAQHSKSLFDKSGAEAEKNALANKTSSEKHLGMSDPLEEEKSSMRKLKSSDGLITDSKKEIEETAPRSSVKPLAGDRSAEREIVEQPVMQPPKQSFKKKASQAQPAEERKPSREQASPKTSNARPAKPSLKQPEPEPKPKAKSISNFTKKLRKKPPVVEYVDEVKPSSSQVLREKRAQLQGLKEEVELSSQQRIKIQKAVEKELSKRTQAEAERQARQREELEQRAHDQRLTASQVKEKLDRISKEKLAKKQEQIRQELKKKREALEHQDHENYQTYLKELDKKEKMQKNRDASQEKHKAFLHATGGSGGPSDKDFVDLQSKNETQSLPLKKAEKSLFDLVNHRARKDFELSNANSRETWFSYNRELGVIKQIPFKKVSQNPDKYQKGDSKKPGSALDSLFKTLDLEKPKEPEAKEEKGKGKGSRSPTPKRNVNGAPPLSSEVGVTGSIDVRKGAPSFGSSPDPVRQSSQDKQRPIVRSDSHNQPKSPRQSSPLRRGDSIDKSQGSPFLDSLLSNPELKNLDPALLEAKVFNRTMEQAKHLVNANQPEEAISLLLSAKDKFTNNRRVDAVKMAAALYQKLGQSDKTKKLLLEALEYMLHNNDIENKEDIFRSILMNLVLIAIEMKDFKEAVSLLKNQAFKDKERLPANYYSLLGDCYLQLGHPQDALAAFDQQLSVWLANQVSFEMIAPLFKLINKIILAQNSLNDQVAIAKFFTKMVGVLRNIKHVNASLLLHENDFDNLLEHLALSVLGFAYDRGNYNLMNYVMNEIVGKDLLKFAENMNEEERVQLCEYFTHFCNYLKKVPNYGGFKANYIKYLDYAKKVIANCDLNTRNLKTNLMILFNRGVYHLQEQNYEKAQKVFDKCLEVYYAFFNEPDKDLYAILYDMGLNLYRQRKFAPSVFYFSKMLDLNCHDPLLKEKATKYLGKVYFRIEEFEKCRATLEPFVEQHFEGKSVINYYKYLSIYFLCLHKLKSDDFGGYLQRLQAEVAREQRAEGLVYLTAYQALNGIMSTHHNYKENDRYLAMVQELVAEKGTDRRQKAARLVNIVSFIHQKYVADKGEEKGAANIALIEALRDRWLTVEENSEMAKDFLLAFLFMLVNRLPLFNERVKNHQFRQKVFDDAKAAVDKRAMNAYLADLFQGLNPAKDETGLMARTLDRLKQTQRAPANVFATEEPDKAVTKIASEQVLLKSAPLRNNCLCKDELKDNLEISALIESFLKQIKNMLFLDVTENVLSYYKRFEQALVEKGLSAEKYSYIKKLVEYHLQRRSYQKLDRLKFTRLLDDLIEHGSLCVHDYKLILLVLESFKEIEYLHILVIYLDTYHPNLAALIFQQVFLGVFEHKYAKIIGALARKINSFRFYQLENFALMHYLDSENFISIEKELAFQIYTRLRYDILHEERLHKLFVKYLDPNDLQMFYVKYNLYNAIVGAVKDEGGSSQELMRTFFNSLSADVLRHQIEEVHSRHFAYEFLTLVHVLRFRAGEDLTEPIFQTLAFVEDRLPQSLYYHFSVLCSGIGNLFFKHRLFEASTKAKLSALDLLNKAQDADTEPPKYFVREDAETHLVQILSFIIAAQVELDRPDQAEGMLAKLEGLDCEFALNELTKLLVKAVLLLKKNETKKASKTIKAANELFGQMNVKDVPKDMYRAALDKLLLLVAVKKDKKEEIAVRARQSEGSIKHLYRPLV